MTPSSLLSAVRAKLKELDKVCEGCRGVNFGMNNVHCEGCIVDSPILNLPEWALTLVDGLEAEFTIPSVTSRQRAQAILESLARALGVGEEGE